VSFGSDGTSNTSLIEQPDYRRANMSHQSARKPSEDTIENRKNFSPLSGIRSPSELCRDVVNLDHSILHASLIGANGNVIVQEFKTGATAFQSPKGIENRYGHWVRMMQGMSKEVDTIFGRTELITIVHQGFGLNAIPLGDEVGALAFVTERSANLEYIATRIRRVIGI